MDAVEKIANRLIRKRSLSPPIDVEALIRERAKLTYTLIPVDRVSGLCLQMKAGPQKAHVLIDMTLPDARKKFTLAHELGHLVIAWHIGSTVDAIGLSPLQEAEVGQEYYALEAEADLFAATLLMPEDWLLEQIQVSNDLAEIHQNVTKGAEVSPVAAAIRLTRYLPAGIVWVIEHDEVVRYQGMTLGTQVPGIRDKGRKFDPEVYSYSHEYFHWVEGNNTIHWWVLPSELSVQEEDPRTWREILDGILADIGYTDPALKKISINGVVGAANSILKQQAKSDISILYTVETLAAMCLQRFSDPKHAEFLEHPDAMLYILKRAKDIFEKLEKTTKK